MVSTWKEKHVLSSSCLDGSLSYLPLLLLPLLKPNVGLFTDFLLSQSLLRRIKNPKMSSSGLTSLLGLTRPQPL